MDSSFGLLSVNVVMAVLLSVAAEWLPGFSGWWGGLTSGKKAQLMALAVAVVTVGLAAVRCYAYDGVCPANWVTLVVETLAIGLMSLGANQGVHLIDKNLKVRRA